MTAILSVASKKLGIDAVSKTSATVPLTIQRSGKSVVNSITKIHFYKIEYDLESLEQIEEASIY